MLSTIATSALGFTAKDLASAGAKRANVKAQATDFCYGLPGNIAPAGDFDPAEIGADFDAVERDLRITGLHDGIDGTSHQLHQHR